MLYLFFFGCLNESEFDRVDETTKTVAEEVNDETKETEVLTPEVKDVALEKLIVKCLPSSNDSNAEIFDSIEASADSDLDSNESRAEPLAEICVESSVLWASRIASNSEFSAAMLESIDDTYESNASSDSVSTSVKNETSSTKVSSVSPS